jgi:hypothetical protein
MKIMLTSLVTALLAIFLILPSAIIMPMNSQGKQNTQQLVGQQQTFPVKKELTINDVRQSRLVLLEGISNAILRLDQSKPGTIAGEFNTTHTAQLLKTDQLGSAVVELTTLQAHVINVFGQEAAIRQVVPQIQNLIAALKTQGPSHPAQHNAS